MKDKVILASASPARLSLLSSIYIDPIVMPADVDETEFPKELPPTIAMRLSKMKAEKIATQIDEGYIIAADTVCSVGRRVLPKALTKDMVTECLLLLSGRRHNIYTGVHIIKKNFDQIDFRHKVVKTVVQFKRLSKQEIEFYSNSNEGINKAGGYAIQGYVESYVSFIRGSFSNIRGLPLYETRNMLGSLGYKLI